MGHRRDGTDDTEGGVVGKDQTVVARDVIRAQVVDARHLGNGFTQLGDLVVEPADLGLFELEPSQLLGLADADLADALDSFAAVFERSRTERLKRLIGGRDRVIDRRKHAEVSRRARMRLAIGKYSRVPHLGQDFLHHVADQIFGHLHGWHRCNLESVAHTGWKPVPLVIHGH
jgi:hypothetical protein